MILIFIFNQNILIAFLLQAFIELLETGILPLFFYWNVFQSFDHLLVESVAFHFFFSNLYAIFYANNHVFVSWIHGHHTLSILLLWIFYSISFSETHNWRKSWFETILWLRARITWLAHSSCFSFSYSPNHHHGASLVA